MMGKKESLKEEFKELVYDSCKALGLDDLPSKLISVLQTEPKEISLGELAEITGYSLSALSTIVRGMEERHLVKRFKKPRSRKVYVLMDKDIISLFKELQKKRYEQSFMPPLSKIPSIIEKYKDMEDYQEEVEIVEEYYQQILFLAEESRKFIQTLEDGIDQIRK